MSKIKLNLHNKDKEKVANEISNELYNLLNSKIPGDHWLRNVIASALRDQIIKEGC